MKLKIHILLIFLSLSLQAQLKVKGKVVDEFNTPLPYVNIIVQGSVKGTTTNDNGKFYLSIEDKKTATIEVSFVGFQSQFFNISSKTKNLNIVLKEEANLLEEIVLVTKPKKRLKKKENPAYRILKEVWKRKRKNGVDLVDYYQYKKQTSIEIGLNNLDTTYIKSIFEKDYNSIIDNINFDNDGDNYYIPIYLREQVSKVYGNNKTNQVKEDIEAEKEEGLNANGFIFNRISNTFRNIDVFKNNVNLLQKSFVSPLSSNGFATYDYVLHDSIVKNNTTLYNIYFFPIRDEDLAFKGNIWIADKSFSIKKLKMKVTEGANLNFVRGLSFDKEFEVRNDSIYLPTKNVYEGDFTFVDKNEKNKGLNIKKTNIFNNYIINKPLSNSFYDKKIEKTRPDQYAREDSYWKKKEDEEKKATYKLINKVKSKRKIKNLTGVLNTVSSGYLQLPINVQLGPLWTTFAQNEVEGFRMRLGYRTFKTKDDRFRLTGHFAYGFGDKKFKLGAEASYLLSYKPRITTNLAYQNDIEQLGSTLLNTTQLLGNSFGSTALFSRGNNFFLSDTEKIAVNFDYAINNNFHFGVNLIHSKIKSASPENFSVSYLDEEGNRKESVVDAATDIYFTYTPGRLVYGLGVQQKFGKNIFPSLVINYHHGYKGFLKGTHDYKKIQFKYNHPILLGKFGLLDATLEAGKTFGTVPISLLSPIPGNQSLSLVANTFTLLNYYDFITDTYVTTHFEHHFNGFFLNRIPLVKKLKLRSLITFRAAYGSVSNQNRAINDDIMNDNNTKNNNYNTPDRIYYEYSIGLENIGYGNLRFFRVDAIWRSNYKAPKGSIAERTPKFAIRIGVKPGL